MERKRVRNGSEASAFRNDAVLGRLRSAEPGKPDKAWKAWQSLAKPDHGGGGIAGHFAGALSERVVARGRSGTKTVLDRFCSEHV